MYTYGKCFVKKTDLQALNIKANEDSNLYQCNCTTLYRNQDVQKYRNKDETLGENGNITHSYEASFYQKPHLTKKLGKSSKNSILSFIVL